jgi:23S rRNA pseudouridine1911/1915/1917 synthase
MADVLKEKFTCEDEKIRLDQFLANVKPEFTRSYFKNLIQDGLVFVNEKIRKKPGLILQLGDVVEVEYPQLKIVDKKDVSSLDIEIIFEHPEFLIINKGPGVLVHAPTVESDKATLVDWLLTKFEEISEVGTLDRPGIVHRLDMDTSGLMIVPRTNFAHNEFGNMFRDRMIKKTYLALVQGHPKSEGSIDFDIVRHPSLRHKMTHVPKHELKNRKYLRSRGAETFYKVLEYLSPSSVPDLESAALVEAMPKTGRTHQIRVHLASIGHPLIGDATYGKPSKLIDRHALHAKALEFDYKGEKYIFEKESPQDFQKLHKILSE